MSPWSFSSMVSSDPSNDPSAAQGNQANAPQVLQSRIGSPVVGSVSPHSPGKGASAPDLLPQTSGSRCWPFGFRFFFGSSSKKQNTTSSSPTSRPSVSIPDSPSSPSGVDRSSPSRGQKANRNPSALDSPTPTPINKKNGMRFVGDDADSVSSMPSAYAHVQRSCDLQHLFSCIVQRDRSIPTSSPPKLKFTSNYRTANGDVNDGGNDVQWSSSAQQSPRSSPRESAITDSNDTPVVCVPSEGTVSASAKMSSSSKSSKRSSDRSRKSKRSESPRLKRASSGKHQSGTPSTAAAPIDEQQPASPTACFVTASSSSSVVIDQQPPDLLLPFPSLTLATTAPFTTPSGPDASGLPNENIESPRVDTDVTGSNSSRNGMEFSPDIRSRMRASPLQSDLHSSSIISNGSNS